MLTGANMLLQVSRIVIIILTLGLLCACGRPPADDASNADSQKLPFDRQPRVNGISPGQALLPSTTKLPEGTVLSIRLQSELSSASSHTGDTFNGTVDEPAVIDGRTLVGRGTPATGRVLEAKPSQTRAGAFEPGYLRIVLVSLNVDGRTVMIETSSIFAKSTFRDDRNNASSGASGATGKDKDGDKDRNRNIVFAIDRRLNFRLAQPVDLQFP